MGDQYLLETGIDGYLLEDSSGTLLIDQRIEVKSSTVGLTESRNNSWFKVIINTLGLTDINNISKGFVKQVSSILGLTDSKNYTISEFEYILEDGTGSYAKEDTGIYLQDYPLKTASSTVGVTESSQGNLGFLKNIAEIIGLTDVENHIKGFTKTVTQFIVAVQSTVNKLLEEINVYQLEDGTGNYEQEGITGRYELDQLAILQNIISTLGLTETTRKLLGPIKMISDIVGLTGVINRAMIMYRNTTSETVGVTETQNRLGNWLRNLSSTVGITETQNRLGVIIRNLTSIVGLSGINNWVRGLRKTITDTVGLNTVFNLITGIVQVFIDTVRLTENNDRIRTVFISNDSGTFTVKDAEDYDNFIVMASLNMDNFVVIDSYNLSNMSIIDDD